MVAVDEIDYYVKIKGINKSDGLYNILCESPKGETINVKTNLEESDFVIGDIYFFKVLKNINSSRNSFFLKEYKKASEIKDLALLDDIYRSFNSECPLSLTELNKRINTYINKIDNKILKDITKTIVNENKTKFYTYPAASRMHHAYVGGLAYHTLGMLDLVDVFIKNYPYISKDYMYAGVILHDIGKVEEFTGIENTAYATEGQLLGHLVIGAMMISNTAKKKGYQATEEAMILEHMIISHHGQTQFGACKKPQTAEANLLWYLDTLDSKLRSLGHELEKVSEGEFTESIAVLDKTKIYKHK